jgi:hypothetical protein
LTNKSVQIISFTSHPQVTTELKSKLETHYQGFKLAGMLDHVHGKDLVELCDNKLDIDSS